MGRYGKGDEGGTTITISEVIFKKFVKKCPEISRYEDSFRWNHGCDIVVRDLSPDQLTELVVVLKECGKAIYRGLLSGT
jgi:hypothetical protein